MVNGECSAGELHVQENCTCPAPPFGHIMPHFSVQPEQLSRQPGKFELWRYNPLCHAGVNPKNICSLQLRYFPRVETMEGIKKKELPTYLSKKLISSSKMAGPTSLAPMAAGSWTNPILCSAAVDVFHQTSPGCLGLFKIATPRLSLGEVKTGVVALRN
ncbi:hypothetical protein F2Q68_00018960 [Brassica cretica]|uniref:Uncharacterized protein n=2 Tax=Brassica TaxID=3705 RepID=A0A8S9G0Z6_BRACR|nr:hypothetical protein F2Q68_00018960 [Brassica cretica]